MIIYVHIVSILLYFHTCRCDRCASHLRVFSDHLRGRRGRSLGWGPFWSLPSMEVKKQLVPSSGRNWVLIRQWWWSFHIISDFIWFSKWSYPKSSILIRFSHKSCIFGYPHCRKSPFKVPSLHSPVTAPRKAPLPTVSWLERVAQQSWPDTHRIHY